MIDKCPRIFWDTDLLNFTDRSAMEGGPGAGDHIPEDILLAVEKYLRQK